jgi:iron(III) transport system substrate-binding protein
MKAPSFAGVMLVSLVISAACSAPSAPAPTAAPPAQKAAAPAAEKAAAPAAEKAAAPAQKAPASAASADAEWEKIVEAGKKEGRVTIYGRLLSGPEGTILADAFKQKHGITVEFIAGAGSPMFSRIKEELKAGRPTADLYEGSQPWPGNIEREGYFVNLKDKPLPSLKDPENVWLIDPWFMSPDKNYLGTRFGDYGAHVAVNSNVISDADLPRNWTQFATDPRYKGKIGWVDPQTTQDIGTVWARHGYTGKGLTLENLWSIYNVQSPQLFANPVEATTAIGRGEVGLGTGTTSSLAPAVQAGAPVKLVVFPDTPIVSQGSAIGIIKDTPNMNAALVFLNWVMSKEGMDLIARTNEARTIRTDVHPGMPDNLKTEVVGGGKRGPEYLLSAAQSELAGEVERAGVMRMLTTGASLADFKAAYEKFLTEWEGKKGGPQDTPLKAREQ